MTVNCFHVRLSSVNHWEGTVTARFAANEARDVRRTGVSGDSLVTLSACELGKPDLPEVSNPSTSRRHELLSWLHRCRHDRAQADIGWPPHVVDSFNAGGLRDDSTLRRPRQVPNEQRNEARALCGFCEKNTYTPRPVLVLPPKSAAALFDCMRTLEMVALGDTFNLTLIRISKSCRLQASSSRGWPFAFSSWRTFVRGWMSQRHLKRHDGPTGTPRGVSGVLGAHLCEKVQFEVRPQGPRLSCSGPTVISMGACDPAGAVVPQQRPHKSEGGDWSALVGVLPQFKRPCK